MTTEFRKMELMGDIDNRRWFWAREMLVAIAESGLKFALSRSGAANSDCTK